MSSIGDFFLTLVGKSPEQLQAQIEFEQSRKDLASHSSKLDDLQQQLGAIKVKSNERKEKLRRTISGSMKAVKNDLSETQHSISSSTGTDDSAVRDSRPENG